jgi:PAS domain S-box-containing protein
VVNYREVTERRQMQATLQARVCQQEAITALGLRALADTDLSTLLHETVLRTAQTLDVEYCKVLELLPDGNALLLRAGVGWQEGLVGHATVSAGSASQAGYTLLSTQPVVVEDLRTETRFSGPPLLHDHGVVSGMSVIIHGRDRPFGILGAHTARQRTFTQDDVHFLQAMANILATALERKRMEGSLRASEERLARLVETNADAIVLLDREGRYTLANAAAEKILGVPRSLITTRTHDNPLWQRLTTDGQPMRSEDTAFVRTMQTGEAVYGIEYIVEHANGMRLNVSINAAPLRDTAGAPVGVVASLRDRTAYKQAEAALTAEASFLRAQVDVARIALSSLQLEVLEPQLLEAIARAQGYANGVLWRVTPGEDTARVVACFGEGAAPFLGFSQELSATTSFAVQTIRAGQPLFVNRVQES